MKKYCKITGLIMFSVLFLGCISIRKIKQKPFQQGQVKPAAVDTAKQKGAAMEDEDDDALYDVNKDSTTNQRLGINQKKDQNDIDFDIFDEE